MNYFGIVFLLVMPALNLGCVNEPPAVPEVAGESEAGSVVKSSATEETDSEPKPLQVSLGDTF